MEGTPLRERIQKVMAARGICSRRAAEAMIAAGRIKVNGRPVKLGDSMEDRDELSIDGETIRAEKKRQPVYIMLYKPRGYLTTSKDERGRRTVMELLADVPQRVYPVGRLDKDSEGLLLFTNDGAFANLVTHPGGGVAKLYRATVRPMATEAQTTRLASGVTLDDGSRTMPASVRVVAEYPDRSVLEITLREGKNRQVRRMCEAVGLQVARLRRSAVGPLKLGMLKPGQWRELTPGEVNALKGSAGKSTRQTPAKKQQPR
ncbi:MAG: rRNA pseudouridine synthase [Ruminococcaceae bacterium]|nr:rRNA pseudouridine synthase [Oscillospiraceae bacterium]